MYGLNFKIKTYLYTKTLASLLNEKNIFALHIKYLFILKLLSLFIVQINHKLV